MLPRRGSRRSSADTEPQFLCHEHEMPWMLLIPTSFSLTNWHLETWPLHCPVSLETESKAGRRMFLQAEAILQLSEFRWVETILINISWIKQTHKHTDSTPFHTELLWLAGNPTTPFLVSSQVTVDSWFLICKHSDSFACPIFSLNPPNRRAHLWAMLSLLDSYTQLGKKITPLHTL